MSVAHEAQLHGVIKMLDVEIEKIKARIAQSKDETAKATGNAQVAKIVREGQEQQMELEQEIWKSGGTSGKSDDQVKREIAESRRQYNKNAPPEGRLPSAGGGPALLLLSHVNGLKHLACPMIFH